MLPSYRNCHLCQKKMVAVYSCLAIRIVALRGMEGKVIFKFICCWSRFFKNMHISENNTIGRVCISIRPGFN